MHRWVVEDPKQDQRVLSIAVSKVRRLEAEAQGNALHENVSELCHGCDVVKHSLSNWKRRDERRAFLQFGSLLNALAGVSLLVAGAIGFVFMIWLQSRFARVNPAVLFIALLFFGC